MVGRSSALLSVSTETSFTCEQTFMTDAAIEMFGTCASIVFCSIARARGGMRADPVDCPHLGESQRLRAVLLARGSAFLG